MSTARRGRNATAGLLLAPLVLTACARGENRGDPPDAAARTAVEAVEAEVDGVIDDLVTRIGAAVDAVPRGGQARFERCGAELAPPSGVAYLSAPLFTAAGERGESGRRTVRRLLERDGWTVTEPANPDVVEGARAGLEIRVALHPATTDVTVRSGCVDTPSDVAEEYLDRGSRDLPATPAGARGGTS